MTGRSYQRRPSTPDTNPVPGTLKSHTDQHSISHDVEATYEPAIAPKRMCWATGMSTPALFADLSKLDHRWGWFLALGILLLALGIVALVYTPAATIASVLVLGWFMFLSGIVEAVHAFHARRWGGVFLHVAGGALGVLIGLLVVTHPVAGALAWTLFLPRS